jgi:hypothetical protein
VGERERGGVGGEMGGVGVLGRSELPLHQLISALVASSRADCSYQLKV